MSYTLFISDLHLNADEPQNITAFKSILSGPATHADALYILGDLFDACIGDDDTSPFFVDIVQALNHFTMTTRIPTYFIRGNRDFLIRQHFANQTGVVLLDDPTRINLYDKKVLLMHGDLLCTQDIAYQQFRKKRHWLQKVTYCLPFFFRSWLANKMREKSKAYQASTELTMLDADPKTVDDYFKAYHADVMIHGHTHRPAIHANNRIVLGAWHEAPSLLYFYNDKKAKLQCH